MTFMLSLPEDWNYSLNGLVSVSKGSDKDAFIKRYKQVNHLKSYYRGVFLEKGKQK